MNHYEAQNNNLKHYTTNWYDSQQNSYVMNVMIHKAITMTHKAIYYDSQGCIILYKHSQINYLMNHYEAQRSNMKYKANIMTHKALPSSIKKFTNQLLQESL